MTEAIKQRNKKISKMVKQGKEEEDYNLSESEEEQQ